MKNRIYTVLYAAAAAFVLLVISMEVVLHTHPYTVRYLAAKVISSVHANYTRADLWYLDRFNDMQDRQMKAARRHGLKEIPASRAELDGIMDRLERVRDCRAYSLAPMGHSVPYLCPGAKAVLDQIGTAFRDSLKSKGLPDHRVVVTSILRTADDVKRLQKTNSIATSNSCHCYGTTFDISYRQFERMSAGGTVSVEELKKVLGEVLRDQRRARNIYVKHELSQPCFHITSRR